MYHMRDIKRGIVYIISGLAAGALAFFWVYPYVHTGVARETIVDAPTVLVIQEGSLGDYATTVSINVDSKEDSAYLEVSENDVSTGPDQIVNIYIGLLYHRSGFNFSHTPLECSVEIPDGGRSDVSVADPQNLWIKAKEQGAATDAPTATGEISVIRLTDHPPTVKIKCPLSREYRFEQVSLGSWSLYLPGIEVYALDGGLRPTISYWVFKEGGEFLQQSSQSPSETLKNRFSWYEWDHDLLARQGLFLLITSPELQRDSAYRLFLAGALVGLGGGLLVAGFQYLTDRAS